MKSLALTADTENIKEAFLNDSIGRNKDIVSFVRLLNSLEGAFTIALDGYWGSGKTFFVKQLKMVLDNINAFSQNKDSQIKATWDRLFRNKVDLEPQVAVYYDAWANDSSEDPLCSILYCILKDANMLKEAKDDVTFKSMIKSAAEICDDVLDNKVTKSLKTALEWTRTGFLDNETNSRKNEERIKGLLSDVLVERGNRLIVFVDELDRCKPDFAVRTLERIKHYFAVDNVTFVFSVNIEELQYTIKRYYGEGFNAGRYLDRFFDLRMALPQLDRKLFFSLIDFPDTSYRYDIIMRLVVDEFQFQMREIIRYSKICKIAAYEPTHDGGGGRRYDFSFPEDKGILFILYALVPILIGLRMYSLEEYKNCIENHDYSRIISILSNEDCQTMLMGLINKNIESFQNCDGHKLIDKKARIIEVCEALFSESYDGNYRGIEFGEIVINVESREILFNTINLMSKYANFTL